ncbi:iron transporter [Denitromonas iodatirespirans]|uniref:Iron transporter n=1 Tax=Denitromonas iodatirespirans TaxID=2795389 RepID=A0A944D963_DENI1|nr:iron transporter [Denitromonas iodatirespirans]MBT0960826.1 iron transporter [Denitromonas iodatirespirans]
MTRRAGLIVSRVLAAVGAGYAFTASVVALVAVALPAIFGMARSEAVVLAAMLGFVIYLLALLWAAVEPRLWWVWAGLIGGAAVSWALSLAARLPVAG